MLLYELVVGNRCVETFTFWRKRRRLKSTYSFIADNNISIERMQSGRISISNILSKEIIKNMIVPWMIKVRQVKNQIFPKNNPFLFVQILKLLFADKRNVRICLNFIVVWIHKVIILIKQLYSFKNKFIWLQRNILIIQFLEK